MGSNSWSLSRTTQCANCPWRVDANTQKIPHYSAQQHRNLINTIAVPGVVSKTLSAMACHSSPESHPEHCVGWIYNQINEGNNIRLRLEMLNCRNARDLKVIGDQRPHFNDTLPVGKDNEAHQLAG